MATRGRKPKPTAIKELEGNPGKRPLNANEPRPERKAPRCPAWLDTEAKREWRRMGKVLEQMGMLYFNGVDSVSISKRLGHAQVSTTANIYAHVMEEADQRNADILANVFLKKA